jgi:NADPH:quinone reductase-like Zn-dependent oxidoreductase
MHVLPKKAQLNLGTDYTAGYIHDIGPNVTRFRKGDRVMSMSCFSVRGHHRYGAHQHFVVASEIHTAHASHALHYDEFSH